MLRHLVLLLALILYTIKVFAVSDCEKRWDHFLEINPSFEYQSLVGLCDDEFRYKLQEIMDRNIDLGYRDARHYMFSELDNYQGEVCGVYTAECIDTHEIPEARIMNCEHTWPQSLGATGIAKSDLHHLYPSIAYINSRRSNHPFCTVSEIITEDRGSILGKNDEGMRCFEAPNAHKGNVARAMFYFAIRYGFEIDNIQERYLRDWFYFDLVSSLDLIRNDNIELVQFNRNLLVDYPGLLEFISDI